MQIAMIGTGYIGLVTGTCFAESGNEVCCVDIDKKKIENLKSNILPIYEPGLPELVQRNQRAGRLLFTDDLGEGIRGRQLVFIGVDTPQSSSGSADISAVMSVVDSIRQKACEPAVVVIKSTVPVGTHATIAERLNQGDLKHRTASNPEFLKEGYAVEDFMRPDRVVVGSRDGDVITMLRELYAPFLRSGHPLLVMSPESAEMTKYAANCCLATKISFINEIANLCERLGADVNEVRQGIGHDTRIGFQFLHPGAGYGGSCFPKDVSAMIALADKVGIDPRLLRAVDAVNCSQKSIIMEKLLCLLDGNVRDKRIAVWGLAFKPRTDDIREAPALVLIRQLLEGGAKVRAFDPEAMENVAKVFGESVTLFDRAYGAAEGADALAVVTEWQEFRNPDLEILRKLMNRPVIVDGRNLYDPRQMSQFGFTYASIGRRTVSPTASPAVATEQAVETIGMEIGI